MIDNLTIIIYIYISSLARGKALRLLGLLSLDVGQIEVIQHKVRTGANRFPRPTLTGQVGCIAEHQSGQPDQGSKRTTNPEHLAFSSYLTTRLSKSNRSI